MKYVLDFLSMAERHKLAQVKAYLKIAADTTHPLHAKVGKQKASTLRRGASWINQAETTIKDQLPCRSVGWPTGADMISGSTGLII